MVQVRLRFLVALAVAGLASLTAPGQAADFYKGKTIDIVVGSTPSGSFDINARTVARHLGRYVPGNPAVIVQNMPGAGSLTALRYVAATAPKDGTAIGVFLPGIITQSIVTPQKIDVDLRAISWVGIVSSDYSRVCYGYGPNGVKSWDDLMRRTKEHPFIMGTTGTGASNYINGASLKLIFDANIKIIFGFPGSAQLRLAVERGELDGDCGGFSSIPPDWIRDDKAHPFVRFGEKLFPGVPPSAVYVGSLAKTERQKKLLDFLYGADKLGRPFVMAKGVPADRLTLVRRAFDATMKDPAFVAEMEKQQQTVAPLTGEEAERVYAGMHGAPPEIVAEAKKIYQ
jgi:tripartite-type tricarboxylate transporter receptor subunit TctC